MLNSLLFFVRLSANESGRQSGFSGDAFVGPWADLIPLVLERGFVEAALLGARAHALHPRLKQGSRHRLIRHRVHATGAWAHEVLEGQAHRAQEAGKSGLRKEFVYSS